MCISYQKDMNINLSTMFIKLQVLTKTACVMSVYIATIKSGMDEFMVSLCNLKSFVMGVGSVSLNNAASG